MHQIKLINALATILVLTLGFGLYACKSGSSDTPPPPTVSGLTQRPSNPDCNIPEAPVTTTGYQLTRVFPNLSFNSPVALRQSPVNADRWYVVEQAGIIKTFLTNDSSATVFADLTARVNDSGGEMGLLGMAFHPQFASNHFIYVYYSGDDNDPATHHSSYISRFTATSDTALNTGSEYNIMTIGQPYSNHNGGNILFGADGYLYIGMGDGGSGGDPQNNAQNINSLLGKMLRIDVNSTSTGKNYAIPSDNPYANTINARPEIFALGLRNPWRWSFERGTNNIIAADVGQNAWEEVDIITNGGNYGWRCYEGNHSYNTSGCAAQNTYNAPIHEYDHNTGYSITGGYVYTGSIPSLVGDYIFTDYGGGPIWAISDPYGTPVVRELINDSISNAISVSSFAEDNAGEIYVLRHSGSAGYIYKITATTSTPNTLFPTQLSATGCVKINDATQMNDGVIPYDINAPFWSDGAAKDRWFAIPDHTTITLQQNGDWSFPNNSVLVKNFRINNNLVETRLLVKHSNGGWAGYSYEWNDTQTDATLLTAGKTKNVDGQNYIYPSSAQCMQCHTASAGIALGPKTRQMNRNLTYQTTGMNANQLDTLNHIGMFSTRLAAASTLENLTVPTNTHASLHDRARAYLYTNCSQCHRPGGGTNVDIDFNITTADADMHVCNVTSVYPGSVPTRLVPGDANASSVYRRMSCREGAGSCTVQDQMPPIGTTVVDTNGAALIAQWINSLSTCPQ